MKDYIALYPNPYGEAFNNELIMGTHDIPMVDLAIMAMREFEAIENIRIEKIEVINDQDEVDINHHTININYKKKDVDSIQIPTYKYLTHNRYSEIVFTIRITTNLNEKVIVKRILIPREHDGFYTNNGKRMKTIWQIVDASTYSQRGKNTIKSRMPIIIYQNRKRMITDVNGEIFVMPSYSYALDTKSKRPGSKKKTKFINPLMIYAAKMGMANTVDFFGMKNIVYFSNDFHKKDFETEYVFPIDNCYIHVDARLFDKYDMVKAFVAMCCNLHSNEYQLHMKHLEDKEYWVCRIGSIGSAKNKNILTFREKGITTIYMIERLLDNITIQNLRLPMIYKHNIYYLLYWAITNFNELRKWSNTDMRNKRIRKNEAIVMGTLGRKINENINKLIEKRSNSKMNTMDTLLELFSFNSDIIVSGMRNLNDLVKSDDIVNDNDFLMSLAFTNKGPSSLGEGSNKKISAKYRYLDPSMIGVLDINTSSNSDVGMSGSFAACAQLYDHFYFTPEHEPCEARYQFDKALKEEEGFDLVLDVGDFRSYLDSLVRNDRFDEMLQYEKIQIVEKETDPVEIYRENKKES